MDLPADLHYSQKHTWDCGLACCAAAAGLLLEKAASSAASIEAAYEALLPLVENSAGGNGVWSIELALALQEILKSRRITPSFHSTLLGINESHGALSFYSKGDTLAADKPRVEALFDKAKAAGLPMYQHKKPLDVICDKLSKKEAIFIALIDLRRLRCQRCLPFLGTGSFQFVFAGHYVLLLDYDYKSDSFRYLDPAKPRLLLHSSSSAEHPHCNCVMLASDFEAARTSIGTDEDLIEIPLKPAPPSDDSATTTTSTVAR
jgi:Guanylylate cyclase